MDDFQKSRDAWWSVIQCTETTSCCPSSVTPVHQVQRRELSNRNFPQVPLDRVALGTELASLSLIHREEPYLLLSRFENIAARLPELRGKSGLSIVGGEEVWIRKSGASLHTTPPKHECHVMRVLFEGY